MAPPIITMLGLILYSTDKAIPWNYGADVYIHGFKQEPLTGETANVTNPDVDNIVGTSKVTRSGRIFSPEISPKTITTPVRISAFEPITEIQGKETMIEPAQMETPGETTIKYSSNQEVEEVLKIIPKSSYNFVEHHAQAFVNFLKSVHVPQEISVDQIENCVARLKADNGLGFSNFDLTPTGRNHNKSMHVSIECRGTTLSHVLVDNVSYLNVLPKVVLDKLDCKGIMLKPSYVVVRAFDGSKRMVHGEIHGAGVVTSTLHQKLKYPAKGKIVTVRGEEEYMVSHLNNYKYVEMDGEFLETPCQTFELVPQTVAVAKPVPTVPKVTRVPLTMDFLKYARVVVEEGGCTIWGQLPDIPYKSDIFGLGFTSDAQKVVCRASAIRITNNGVPKDQDNVVEDTDSDCALDSWIFPTIGRGLNNWKAEDIIPIFFSQE
ncbi:uncharacterized protein LOC131648715 [Vicia villosa]|uniref:uncharacterized protein LOC131648715 n=1 Tax=Vicia villosa TaxID=3911 RepID=UPI00273B2955|nr:uncharacterized protein LOC131648715 [Vicia villosa]